MGKGRDITGQRFGKLVALRPTEIRSGNKSVVWECQCDCGSIKLVARSELMSGNVLSCGCLRREGNNKGNKQGGKNLSGMRFGSLVAVQPTDQRKRGYVVWECSCDCGNTIFIASDQLTSGKKKFCGCLNEEKNIAGKKFGKLLAICPTDERNRGAVVWECKCDCGMVTRVPRNMLIAGRVRSCGCLRRESAGTDLVGQRFGRLTVIRDAGTRQYREKVWECQCDCGNTVYVPTRKLTQDIKHSCGCMKPQKHVPAMPEIIGERFGRLTAVRFVDGNKYWGKQVECRCECGKFIVVPARELVSGVITSCGCTDQNQSEEPPKTVKLIPQKDKRKSAKKDQNIVGKKFGKLCVIRFVEGTGKPVECACECGNTIVLPARKLVGGAVKECGQCSGRVD